MDHIDLKFFLSAFAAGLVMVLVKLFLEFIFGNIYRGVLRDWLAGQALRGIISHGEPEDVQHNAIVAYRNADALLKQRKEEEDADV